MNKISSYIGFAIKSNKYLIGQSKIKQTKKQIYLILLCNTATQNLQNLAQNVANRHNCAVLKLNSNLQNLTHIPNIKIFALLDENLAKAIINDKENI